MTHLSTAAHMTTAEAGKQGDTQLQSIVRYVRYRAFDSRTELMPQRVLDVPVGRDRAIIEQCPDNGVR